MDRVAIKNQAKEMIRGNKWFIWKPLVFLFLISCVVGFVGGLIDGMFSANGVVSGIVGLVWVLFSVALGVGYSYYVLEFVRGNKLEWKAMFTFAKEHWVVSILSGIIMGIIVCIGEILLVIPGIIAAIGLYFWSYVIADNPDLGAFEVIKKSWNLTKGYKGFIFVALLSFIGWAIVAEFTLGILYIWLMPYILVTFTLIYENLKAIQK